MRNPNGEPQIEQVKYDLSRLSPEVNAKDFFESLKALQIPCPWGDLAKGEGIPNEFPDMPELNQIPHIPLGLVIGAGRPIEDAYRSVASAAKFGKIVYSDIYDPRMGPENYIRLDLNDPKTIDLFGFKVHALMSIGVFTYDGAGVNFRSQQAELEAAQKLTDMLMSGGIVANDNLSAFTRRFEKILEEQFGFQIVRDTHSVILQKPF